MEEVFYRVPSPNSMTAVIEVYGSHDQAWSEFRIIDNSRVLIDTGDEGHHAFKGRQYGQPEIALRDALIYATRDET